MEESTIINNVIAGVCYKPFLHYNGSNFCPLPDPLQTVWIKTLLDKTSVQNSMVLILKDIFENKKTQKAKVEVKKRIKMQTKIQLHCIFIKQKIIKSIINVF